MAGKRRHARFCSPTCRSAARHARCAAEKAGTSPETGAAEESVQKRAGALRADVELVEREFGPVLGDLGIEPGQWPVRAACFWAGMAEIQRRGRGVRRTGVQPEVPR